MSDAIIEMGCPIVVMTGSPVIEDRWQVSFIRKKLDRIMITNGKFVGEASVV